MVLAKNIIFTLIFHDKNSIFGVIYKKKCTFLIIKSTFFYKKHVHQAEKPLPLLSKSNG